MMPHSGDLLLKLYRMMFEMREFELKLQEVYRSGVMPGFIHLYIGQEAVAAGVCSHLRPDDYVTSTHRGHGHALATGVPARELFAEIWGKATGSCGGRGGSMHIYAPEHGFLGTNGIVGAGIPLAAGAALSASLAGKGQVAICFFGEGAVNNCAFHEGLNMAATWDVPAVFVCENNLYATEMPFSSATKNTDVAARGSAYKLPGYAIDGNDVTEVYRVAGEAIENARAGKGPTLIECRTYRVVGHHEGDPGTEYRTKDEVAAWRNKCPLKQLRTEALRSGKVSEEELLQVEKDVTTLIADAVAFARASPEPEISSVTDHVFA
jgi:TPP-dependent pyruvate/acetoin dehydrogenase alpha subunit